jgi:hypothetical protein
MLDTIILEIEINFKAIIEPNKFKPNTRAIETFMGWLPCKNNPTADDKKNGIYKPKLTVMRREFVIILKVEFSAPKILWKNNLDEIEEKDFNEMVAQLQSKVRGMGVMLQTSQIENAKVIGFHPSKNIVLSKPYTSPFALRELYKINLSQKLDFTRAGFRNEGEEIQFYTKIYSVVFYDKINDLTKPPTRATDKNQPKLQRGLFDYIKKDMRGLEVLRFEVRFSKSEKMKQVLAEVGFNQEPTLKNIFKKDLCQKIVKFYWESLFDKNMFLFNTYNNPQKVLEMILIKYPKTKMKTAVMLVGLNLLCKDESGFRGFRKIVERYKEKKNWLALGRYLEKFEDDYFKQPRHGFINDIQQAIDKFEAFKLNKKS